MSAPLVRGKEPGGGEFSYGRGLLAPQERGAIYPARVLMGAVYQLDPANPDADIQGTFVANPTQTHVDPVTQVAVMGDLEEGATPRVRETGQVKSSGIDPSKFNPGHYADGLQDGSGDIWRASLPPNPVV
jgi:hypothetical protein